MINEYGKTFETKDEFFAFLRANKSILKQMKRASFKKADGVGSVYVINDYEKKIATKSDENLYIQNGATSYHLTAVINTCNYLDSHNDVHIAGCWKKSISEKLFGLHLQEHEMDFDHVIDDKVKASTSLVKWSDLGYSFDGSTECLIHDLTAQIKRNEFMANQYANGWVKQHSVGMYYVNLFMCINSESQYDKEEKDNWNKYYPMVVNQDRADEKGYFWAVTECRYVEGSAVVRGSNPATPTTDFQFIEPSDDTQKVIQEPTKSLKNRLF